MNDQNTSDEQPEKLSAESPEQDAAGQAPENADAEAAPDQAAPPAPAYADLGTQDLGTQDPGARRWLPSTAAGRSRLVAAGVAGAFLLGGGVVGYAIGQAGDDHDRGHITPADFEGRGPGGPDGGPGGGFRGGPDQQGQPGTDQGQQAPGSTSGSAQVS